MEEEREKNVGEFAEYSPMEVEFTVKINAKDTLMKFRPFVGSDELYFERMGYSKPDKLQGILDNFLSGAALEPFYKLLARQLTPDCIKRVRDFKIIEIDDDCNENEIEDASIAQKLMYSVYSHSDKLVFLKSFLQCRGISLPMIEKISEKVKDEVKKKS